MATKRKSSERKVWDPNLPTSLQRVLRALGYFVFLAHARGDEDSLKDACILLVRLGENLSYSDELERAMLASRNKAGRRRKAKR